MLYHTVTLRRALGASLSVIALAHAAPSVAQQVPAEDDAAAPVAEDDLHNRRIGPDGTIIVSAEGLRQFDLLAGTDVISGEELDTNMDGQIGEVLTQARATTGQSLIDEIATAATRGERLFLRLTEPPHLTLRGHAVAAAGSETAILINLGFGIGLTDAVSHAGLTDQDFAPAELAMELLFLHEANRAALSELSNFNQQLQAAREAAELQAHTDPLTGLTNRRGVELVLSAALKTFRDGKGAGFALAQLDLDRFKDVNDRLGHAAGDRVLCDVADILKEAIRSNDTAARVGGDEFLLILRDLNRMICLDIAAQ